MKRMIRANKNINDIAYPEELEIGDQVVVEYANDYVDKGTQLEIEDIGVIQTGYSTPSDTYVLDVRDLGTGKTFQIEWDDGKPIGYYIDNTVDNIQSSTDTDKSFISEIKDHFNVDLKAAEIIYRWYATEGWFEDYDLDDQDSRAECLDDIDSDLFDMIEAGLGSDEAVYVGKQVDFPFYEDDDME